MKGIDFEKISRILFVCSCVFLAFLYGVIVKKFELFPHRLLDSAWDAFRELTVEKRPHHLFPVRYENAGVKVYKPDEIAPGLTLITSYWREFDWKTGIRLIDAAGNVLHQWQIDPAAIWPTSPHEDYMAGSKNNDINYVHGTYLFENGDVLFNIEYLGLVRMNACSEVVWRLPYRTHHSVFRTETGDFWISGLKWLEDTPEGRERLTHYPGLRPPAGEDVALKVSPEGVILKEVSLLDALYKGGYGHLFWKIGKRFAGDITHLNDVEALKSSMADQYPLFEAGDLVVSMKYIHAVFVLDPETGNVKWLTTEPIMEQHDPDFIGDGWIAIFDNNSDGSDTGQYLGGSRIIAKKPGFEDVKILYPTELSQPFHTEAGGKLQVLENGNFLITEARAGRILEANPSGQTVWEWKHEPYNDDLVAEVLEGSRYQLTPADVSSWNCNH